MFKKILCKLILISILFTGPVFAKKEKNSLGKVTEPKKTEIKVVETKTTEVQATGTKAAEPKKNEAQIPVPKTSEIKEVESKATDTELAETKETEVNATDTEESDLKAIAADATETFQSGPLSEDDVIAMLKEKHKGSIVGVFMESYPRLVRLTVRATMDENIKKLWANTIKDKTRYYLLIGFFLLTVLINWFWKRDQIRSDNSIPKRVLGFFYRFFLINIARVGFFIFLFPKEIYPVWVLFRKVFSI